MKANIEKVREFILEDRKRHGSYGKLKEITGISDRTINGWVKDVRMAPGVKRFVKYVTNIDRAPEEKEEYLKAAGIPKEAFPDWMYECIIYGRKKEPGRILTSEEMAKFEKPENDIDEEWATTDKLMDIHDGIMAECEEISRTLHICLGLSFAMAKEDCAVSRDAMGKAMARILHIIGAANKAIIRQGNDLYCMLEKQNENR